MTKKLHKKTRLLDSIDLINKLDVSPQIHKDERGKSWLTSKSSGEIQVFYNECPHQGHPFAVTKKDFVCQGHFWKFNADGTNKVPNGQCLREATYEIENNQIFIVESSDIIVKKERKFEDYDPLSSKNLEIEFISHASLKLTTQQVKIITDPWISETTYWGHWIRWPNLAISKEVLDVDYIVLTHEHPDHFHPDSLNLFSRETQVIFPDFISGRIPKKLNEMGFKNLHSVPFDEPFQLEDEIELIYLRPSSRWEDSVSLLNVAGFRWLNVNDAGYIGNSKHIPDKVDLLTATFDIYATDFPLCWDSVNLNKRKTLAEVGRSSILSHLANLTKKFDATYYLPFASFWRLNNLDDLERQMHHITISDIREEFQRVGIEDRLMDLLPGETFSFGSQQRQSCIENREEVVMGSYPSASRLDKAVDQKMIEGWLSPALVEDIRSYFLKLSSRAAAFQCEPVLFELIVGESTLLTQEFGDPLPNFERVKITAMTTLEKIVELINESSNWEWMRIGYWIKFSRDREIYTPNFLRLLAFGSAAFEIFDGTYSRRTPKDDMLNQPISKFIFKNPLLAQRILNRYGMPCSSCSKSNMESLRDAFDKHDLRKSDVEDILAAFAHLE